MATQSPPPDNQAYSGAQDEASNSSEANALNFVVRQILGGVWVATPVQVMAVTPGGVGSTATVDILPLVNQLDGANNATPHGTIYGVPVMRIQGGANALIIDPEVNDIGVAIFCHSDISSVVATKAQANPGSRRKFDPSDAIYLGSILGAVPATRYILAAAGGISIVAPDQVTIAAPTINLNGAVVGNSTAVFTGDVTGAGTSLHTHVQTDVTIGTGNSGPPL